jgi:anti-repressor protein
MNDLIAIGSSNIGGAAVQTVNARELHQFLEVGKDFSTWIKGRIEQYGFLEGQDYGVFTDSGGNLRGGRPTTDYALTIDMAKELAMVERTYRGKQARLYFIECEKRAKAPPPAPVELTRMELIQMALAAEQEKLLLAAKVEEQAPKVEALERIAESDGSLTIRAAAKVAQMQETPAPAV